MLVNEIHAAELNANEQVIRARVELYNGSTLAKICNCGEMLSDFAIEKTGEGKYFGFGICQKLKATLIDLDNTIDIEAVDGVEVAFGVDGNFLYPYPKFMLQEAKRDEVFGVIDIAAYDALFLAAKYRVSDLKLPAPYTLEEFAKACAALLGLPLVIDAQAASAFKLNYEAGANFDGTETVRSAMDALAEATQTIYYIDGNWNLFFKRLDKNAAPVLTVTKNKYINLTDEGAHTLANLAMVTELGDNIETPAAIDGDTQYLRENPFLELRTDAGALLEQAATNMAGLTIHQYNCDWAGNYLLEIGDRVNFIKDDNTVISTYLLDDNISFNGAMWQVNAWEYGKDGTESATNPTTLGDALNQTIARVDKTKQEITLLAQKTENEFASLVLKTDKIEGTVSGLESAATIALETEQALLTFQRELETTGADKVTTATGFKFNDEGLTISKSDSDINTTITEDGMRITRQAEEVLTANNEGVKAEDLHATTFLIIGNNSRLEDFNGRTACFWIGK